MFISFLGHFADFFFYMNLKMKWDFLSSEKRYTRSREEEKTNVSQIKVDAAVSEISKYYNSIWKDPGDNWKDSTAS